MSFIRALIVTQALLLLIFAGCDAPLASFDTNRLYIRTMELNEGVELDGAEQDVAAAVTHLFGTPDAPKWPEVLRQDPYQRLVDIEQLERAAGPVRSDEEDRHVGLYREHCVFCHGITGDGRGPTSRLLNPYPRDFRPAIFKFKSTEIGEPPSREDLLRTLQEGIPGTSMPSFRLLKPEDLDALADYLTYLSIRGQVERELINEAAFELDFADGDRLFDLSQQESAPEEFKEQLSIIEGYVTDVADEWSEVQGYAPEVEGPPEGLPLYSRDYGSDDSAVQAALVDSVAQGRDIYHGKVANCASCHGPTGMGDGQMSDYDNWTKEWTTSVAIDPKDKDAVREMIDLGAHKPRNILPRNLRSGVYRGGSRPVDLYLRIVNGIDGTPMPAAAMQPRNPQGLTQEQVWHLVNFLLSLPDENL